MIAWVTGTRSAKTFKKLYDKVKHLKNCIFYTDSWDAFSKVLPKERHIIGKQYTVAIEQDNSNIRNDLAGSYYLANDISDTNISAYLSSHIEGNIINIL